MAYISVFFRILILIDCLVFYVVLAVCRWHNGGPCFGKFGLNVLLIKTHWRLIWFDFNTGSGRMVLHFHNISLTENNVRNVISIVA